MGDLWLTRLQVGSVIQWYESLNKYPIWVDKRVERLGQQAG